METDPLRGPVIIGAGPGGIAAAIQLKRSGINPLVFEKNSIGGLIRQANCVENYPGYVPFTSGIRIAEQLAAHFSSLSIPLIHEEVVSVEYSEPSFVLKSRSRAIRAQTLVLASGTRPKSLKKIPMDSKCMSRVVYDVNRISRVPAMNIVVVGGGDAAFDYALNLAQDHRVAIVVRSSRSKCLPILEKRVRLNGNIVIHFETVIRNMICQNFGIQLHCAKGSGKLILEADWVLAAIGREPELSFLNPSVKSVKSRLMKNGQLKLVGDVANGTFRQLAITVGNGIQAAMEIAARNNREE